LSMAAQPSVSEQTIRELVFRDCEKATAQVGLLRPTERDDFIQFLMRVLALNTEAPNVVEAFVISPGDARVRDAASQIWRSVDARSDLEAKQCALRLLEKLGPDAFSLLPELVRFYGDESLGDELAVRMEETVAAVSASGVTAGLVLSESAMDRMIGALFLPRPLLARNVLIEVGSRVFPRIVDALLTFSDDGLRQILPVLREVDPTRVGVLRTLLARAEGLEPEAIELALSRLGLARYPVLAEVVDAVAQGAATLPLPASLPFQRLLGQFCLEAGHLKVEPTVQAALSATWNDTPRLLSGMPKDVQECLVRSFPELVDAVATRIRLGESEDGLEEIEPLILALTESDHPSSQDILYGALRDAFQDGDAVAPAGLPLLTLFPRHREETLKLYFQAAKRIEKLPTQEAGVLVAALSAGLEKADAVSRERMIPVLLGWLRRGLVSERLTGVLSLLLPKVERELLNAWRTVGNEAKESILRAFFRAQFWSLRAGKVCFESLQSERLRDPAEMWFALAVRLSPEARRFVRERAVKLHDPERVLRLARLGVLTVGEIPQLEAVLKTLACSSVEQSWNGIVEAIRPVSRFDALGPVIQRCLVEFSNDQIVAAVRVIPVSVVLGEGAARDRLFASDRFEFIASALMDQPVLKEPAVASVLLKSALRNPSRRLQRRVLTLLREDTSHVDGDLLVRVRELASITNDESSIRRMAIEILASKGDPEIDWDSFVRQLIDDYGEGQSKPFGTTALHLLPDRILHKPILDALAARESSRVVGGARVAGQLRSRGFPLVPKLWDLREHPLFEVRVAVILSLLEIVPATPGLTPAVESILVTRSFPRALERAIRWNESAVASELSSQPLSRLKRGRLVMLSDQARRE
jgi:hypothetical protein